jgi:hypothetical protein
MKKATIAGLGLVLMVSGGISLAADSTTVTGHLRDGFCYTIMGAKGPTHKKCAMGCASKGIPVMLVDDKTGKAYVLLPPKDDSALPADVIAHMEDDVTLTGQEYSKDGISYFQVQSVK